jgi:hypothetical protein
MAKPHCPQLLPSPQAYSINFTVRCKPYRVRITAALLYCDQIFLRFRITLSSCKLKPYNSNIYINMQALIINPPKTKCSTRI